MMHREEGAVTLIQATCCCDTINHWQQVEPEKEGRKGDLKAI